MISQLLDAVKLLPSRLLTATPAKFFPSLHRAPRNSRLTSREVATRLGGSMMSPGGVESLLYFGVS